LSFDAQAAGYVLGECSISVVLKPYAEKAHLAHLAAMAWSPDDVVVVVVRHQLLVEVMKSLNHAV
jgi:acyl transferase domain-containing protein